jgi:hypothetical protein
VSSSLVDLASPMQLSGRSPRHLQPQTLVLVDEQPQTLSLVDEQPQNLVLVHRSRLALVFHSHV